MNANLQAVREQIQKDYASLNLHRRGQNLIRATSQICITVNFSEEPWGINLSIHPLSEPIHPSDLSGRASERFGLSQLNKRIAYDPFHPGAFTNRTHIIDPNDQQTSAAWIAQTVQQFHETFGPVLKQVTDSFSAFSALTGLRFANIADRRRFYIQADYLANDSYSRRGGWFFEGPNASVQYSLALECRYYDFLSEYMRRRIAYYTEALHQYEIGFIPSLDDVLPDMPKNHAEVLAFFQKMINSSNERRLHPDFDRQNQDFIQALIAESPVSHLEPMENEILQRNPIVPPDSESHAEAMRQALAYCTEALSHFEAHDDAYVQAIIDENRPANVELINSILPKKLHIQ